MKSGGGRGLDRGDLRVETMGAIETRRMCIRCVMDDSDPAIVFDGQGVCSHCRRFDEIAPAIWLPNERGKAILEQEIARMRAAGRGREYDCLIGLSGGVDSAFLAMRACDWGLRPLIVHVDTGWNSELATANIEMVVKAFDFDLATVVIDWEEMRDLQVAFLRAGVPNQDTPQDHAIIAGLYRTAEQYDVAYVVNGENMASESVLPTAWGYTALDPLHIRAIHDRWGRAPLVGFPLLSFSEYASFHLGRPDAAWPRPLSPLNLIPYDRAQALTELQERTGYRPYRDKHGESRFTLFFQGHLLPTRFGYDKRRAHLSSLILSGQIVREQALAMLAEPVFPPRRLEEETRFIRKKLGLSEAEWAGIMNASRRSHADFPNGEAALQELREIDGRIRALENAFDRTLADADAMSGFGRTLGDWSALDRFRPIHIYGAGEAGRSAARTLIAQGYGNIAGFIDSWRGGVLDGLPIRPLDDYLERRESDDQVLVCSQHHREITRTLLARGVRDFARPPSLPDGGSDASRAAFSGLGKHD